MAKVARSFRLDEGLVRRVESEADRLGQKRTTFVERALEAALATGAGSGEDARVSPARLPGSPRASEPVLRPAHRGSVSPSLDPDRWKGKK